MKLKKIVQTTRVRVWREEDPGWIRLPNRRCVPVWTTFWNALGAATKPGVHTLKFCRLWDYGGDAGYTLDGGDQVAWLCIRTLEEFFGGVPMRIRFWKVGKENDK